MGNCERPFRRVTGDSVAKGSLVNQTTKLTAKERLFALHCALLGNAADAARLAGYSEKVVPAKAVGLLRRAEIREDIFRCRRLLLKDARDTAVAGLLRLALGGVADAVRLMMADGELSPGEIYGLDLFAVSEIKRPKGGGFEIKFHDRTRALALLLEHGQQTSDTDQNALLEALDRSARVVALLPQDHAN